MYRPGTGIVGFVTGGVERMNITAGTSTLSTSLKITEGNGIGLGTANPNTAFNINMADSFTPNGTRAGIFSVMNVLDGTLTANRQHYGIFNSVRNDYLSEEAFTLTQRGVQNEVINGPADDALATLNTAEGSRNRVLNRATGSVGTGIGSYNTVQTSRSGSTMTSALGTFSEVLVSAGTVTTAYGVWARVRPSAAGATMTTGYLFFGDTSTVNGTWTNRWGVFINVAINNYFLGGLQVGGTATGSTSAAGLGVGVSPPGAGNITASGTISGGSLDIGGSISVRAATTTSAATQIPVFTADPASTTRTLVTRTPAQLRGDIGAGTLSAVNLGITAGTTAGPIITNTAGTNATLPIASATASGVVSTGNQTWLGVKTFSSAPVINASLAIRAATTTSAATQIPVFTANPASTTRTLVTRTPAQLREDIGAGTLSAVDLGITAGTTAGPIITNTAGTNATLPIASETASGVVSTGNQIWAGVKRFRGSSSVRVDNAVDQDGIFLSGRAGGTTGLRVTIRPTTLTGNRTLTLPNANGTVALEGSSDYRLKENIVPLTDSIDKIKKISVYRFNYLEDPTTTLEGFIAHELQDIVPHVVTGYKDKEVDVGIFTNENGDIIEELVPEPEVLRDGQKWEKTGREPVYQEISYSKMVPLLTAALQEALSEIELLKIRLTNSGL
jgi:hypothetical protein